MTTRFPYIGPTGPVGANGIMGPIGATGPRGATGVKGDTGEAGHRFMSITQNNWTSSPIIGGSGGVCVGGIETLVFAPDLSYIPGNSVIVVLNTDANFSREECVNIMFLVEV